MSSKKHTHKYHRVNNLWHCALSDCTHYMPANVTDNVLGKESICWGCNGKFKLDEDNMKMDKPKCIYCVNPNLRAEENVMNFPPTDIMAEFLKHKEQNK